MIGGGLLRTTVFGGGAAGGVASAGIFFIVALASVFLGIRQISERVQHGPQVPVLEWTLLAVGVTAFLLGVPLDGETERAIFGAITLICIAWSLILGLRDLVSKLRTPKVEQAS